MRTSTKLVELGVCQLGNKDTQGNWGYHLVGIPANTPDEVVKDVATRAFLETHGTALVHHTWVQTVGAETILGEETADDDQDFDRPGS